MATSFGALCTDFFINQKLAMKMDLPTDRETVLHLFDRLRKSEPSLVRFRKFDRELALESARGDEQYRWVAVWHNHIRSGVVNPESMDDGYRLHRLLLEISPYHLTISPLDVDYLELTLGFELECEHDHDEVVADALFADSPLDNILNFEASRPLDVQPIFGVSITEPEPMQAYFEVKTRRKSRRGSSARYRDEPITILLSLRKYGPVEHISDLPRLLQKLAGVGEALTAEQLVPNLLVPISRQITSSSA